MRIQGIQIMTMASNPLDTFKYFIDHQMQMRAIYQPVLIRTVIQMGGSASRSVVAKEIELEDSGRMGDQTAYEDIVMKLPGQVLEDRGWVSFDRITDEYRLTIDITSATEDEVNALIRSCELRIKTYQATGTSGVNGPRKYFALFANPRVYRVEDAIASVEQDLWVTKGRDLAIGDRLLIWRGVGLDGNRGIVGFGEVVSPPQITDDPGNPYWVDPLAGSTTEERVLVKYLPLKNGPLWTEEYPLLQSLSVARARGGTVFNISEDDWGHVIHLARGWPENRPEHDPTGQMHEIQGELEALGEFDPTGVEDARTRIYRQIVLRSGQPVFRQELLDVYEGRCAFTGYDFTGALEACHIVPYQGPDTNHVTNGLLLRADIHTLFDLGKISIRTSDMTLVIADELKEGSYGHLSGSPITLPIDPVACPNVDALNQHRELAGL